MIAYARNGNEPKIEDWWVFEIGHSRSDSQRKSAASIRKSLAVYCIDALSLCEEVDMKLQLLTRIIFGSTHRDNMEPCLR